MVWRGYQLSFWARIPFTLARTWILFLHSFNICVHMCPVGKYNIHQSLLLSTTWIYENVSQLVRWETPHVWTLPIRARFIFTLWCGGDTNFLFGPVFPLPWPEPGSYFYTPLIFVCICAQLVSITYINHSCSPQLGYMKMFPSWSDERHHMYGRFPYGLRPIEGPL